MPKKRKKAGDNFAHLDPEQRRQYLERKALQEQEKTRKREELLEGFLKLKLDDEKQKSKINESKLNEKWRILLRKSTKDQLFTQLKAFCEGIYQVISYMESIIQFLTTSVKEVHSQRKLSSQKNISFVNTLTGIHEGYLYLLTKAFRQEEYHLLNKHNEDLEAIKNQHCSYLREIMLMSSAASLLSDEEEAKTRFQFQNSLAMAKIKLENEYMTAIYEEQKLLQDGWILLATSQKCYEEETSQLRLKCQMFLTKFNNNMKLKEKIDQEIKSIQKIAASSKYRNCFILNKRLFGGKNSLEMKILMYTKSVSTHRCRLRQITKISNRISSVNFKQLENLIGTANVILSLLNLCKKMETLDDKNIPFFFQSDSQKGEETPSISQESKKIEKQLLIDKDSGADSLLLSEECKSDEIEISVAQDAEVLAFKTNVTNERIQRLIGDEVLLLKKIQEEMQKKTKNNLPYNLGVSEFAAKESEDVTRNYSSFCRFWLKLNRIQIQSFSLSKEGKDLENENKNLKANLKKYFSRNNIKI